MYQLQQSQKNDSKTHQQKNQQFNFKRKLFKIGIIILCLPIIILVIYVLSISVDYFSLLFSLTNELSARTYLSQYYTSYMTLLYISIIGFVIIVTNTIVFQFQFSQKTKVLYFHIIYFIAFLIAGIVNRSLTQYNKNMELLSTYNALSVNCTSRQFIFQCNLSKTYVEYNSKVQIFFIVETIFVLIYICVYHAAAIYELNDLSQDNDQKIKEIRQISQKNKNGIINMPNEQFISEIEFN